jgi:hypothetical protein
LVLRRAAGRRGGVQPHAGSIPLRLGVAAAAIGVVLWYALPVSYLIRHAPLRDVVLETVPLHVIWLNNYQIVAIAAAALLYVTHADDVERSLETKRCMPSTSTAV